MEKTKILTSIILAILLPLLIFGLSIFLFPEQKPMATPGPKPGTSILDQIFLAVFWIGLAAIFAIAIVGAILLASRVRRKETQPESDINVDSQIAGFLNHSMTDALLCTVLHYVYGFVVVVKGSKTPFV